MVVQLAKHTGHHVYHTHDSRRSEPGFPDLVIAKPGMERLLVAELKFGHNKRSVAQEEWGEVLEAIPGVDYRLWYPAHWPEIEETLIRG